MGGTAKDEFYCSYHLFQVHNVERVYSEEDLQAPELVNDYPINMRGSDLKLESQNPDLLP